MNPFFIENITFSLVLFNMLIIVILSILIFATISWADKICLREIEGEKVYTNLCEKKIKPIPAKNVNVNSNNKNKQQTISLSTYTREYLEKIVEDKSNLYGLDAKLVKEIIKEESNWNVYATSPKGAMGVMQLMPSTALLLGVKNPYDPEENIDGGIRYMKYLLQRFNGNLNLALAAYNAGPNLVESLGRIPDIAETKQYVARISMRYNGTLPYTLETSSLNKKSPPIKAVILSDGTVLYTNREYMYIWSKK